MGQFITSCLHPVQFFCLLFILSCRGNFCALTRKTTTSRQVMSSLGMRVAMPACNACVRIHSRTECGWLWLERKRWKKRWDVHDQHVSRLWTFRIFYYIFIYHSRASAVMRKFSNYYSLPYLVVSLGVIVRRRFRRRWPTWKIIEGLLAVTAT